MLCYSSLFLYYKRYHDLCQDLNNGFLIQYGIVGINSDYATFPIAFTTTCIPVGTMCGAGQAPGMAIHDVTLTDMVAYRGAGWGWFWIAIGY